MISSCLNLLAQDPSRPDSLRTKRDSLRLTPDSLMSKLDAKSDTVPSRSRPKSDIATTINYNARDSMFFDLSNQKLFMYGDTHLDYDDITLEAEQTSVDWTRRTIKAEYAEDSLGNKVGKPVFKDGEDVYVTDDILYNFKSRKAQIKGVVTEQEGAIMHGENVKKNEKNEMFIRRARYTTCNLENPHFFIESKKLKVIPKNKVVSGPFNLKFREVPTPLWLPIGMFPQPNKKTSGFIMPVYGEERERGFFLRDGGYYFALGEGIDLRLTGDIYSKGSNGLTLNSNYYRRYRFRGAMNVSYTNNVTGDFENRTEAQSYWVRWNHTPESRGASRFSASVSAGSTSYNQNNNLVISDFQRSQQAQFSSNVSYRTSINRTPYNLNINLRHNQNLQTEVVNLTLPELTLNMSRVYPFKNLVNNPKSPLANINMSHTFTMRNELTNAATNANFGFEVANDDFVLTETIPFDGENFSRILERGKIGARHQIPISTSLNVLKHFTLTPNINYTEVWYTKELAYTDYDPIEGGVRVDTVNGFSRAGSYNTGMGLSTILYGFYTFKSKKIEAIRHVITPTIGFVYNPDFTDPRYGVFKNVVIDSLGTVQQISKYNGFNFGSPPAGESRRLSFTLTNNLEMKVVDKKDTTGTGTRKIKLIENLSFNTGYNFAAEAFKLDRFSWSFRTSFFNKAVGLAMSGTVDPYIYQLISRQADGSVVQERIERFAWNNGGLLGNLESFRAAVNVTFKGGKGAKGSNSQEPDNAFAPIEPDPNLSPTERQQLQQEIDYIQNNPNEYVDFDIPWSLRANYTLNRTQVGFQSPTVTQGLSFSGTLALTQKTQLTFNSSYNFTSKEFQSTRLSVSRDLHCWTLDFNWVPFGRYQSYSVVLRVKSPILQDLKLQKRRSFLDF